MGEGREEGAPPVVRGADSPKVSWPPCARHSPARPQAKHAARVAHAVLIMTPFTDSGRGSRAGHSGVPGKDNVGPGQRERFKASGLPLGSSVLVASADKT